MIDRLANLAQSLASASNESSYPRDARLMWGKHLETVREMIGIYDEWQEMWRMLAAEDPNSCVALAEDIGHKHKIIHYDLDMDDLYERVRD